MVVDRQEALRALLVHGESVSILPAERTTSYCQGCEDRERFRRCKSCDQGDIVLTIVEDEEGKDTPFVVRVMQVLLVILAEGKDTKAVRTSHNSNKIHSKPQQVSGRNVIEECRWCVQ
jgi:hypothetical protein